MNIESMISGMSHSEMLAALDLLWTRLSRNPDEFESPAWHKQVLTERIENWDGKSVPLDEAVAQIENRLNERRTSE